MQMKNVLITSFDMEVGGVERSLAGMLNQIDDNAYKVDLMLYSHTGDFMHLLPKKITLLPELLVWKTFRMSIKDVFKHGKFLLGLARVFAKVRGAFTASDEKGIQQMQYMWTYALPFLPRVKGTYDVAISYLWPHYTVAEKVDAKIKIAWIHTDYSTVDTNKGMDLELWNKFHHIIAVSDACKQAFIKKYPKLADKVLVIENMISSQMVRTLAEEHVDSPMEADNRFKVITVARLSYAKGIDQAVKAIKLLKDRGYPVVWYVVGYGGDEKEIRQLISRSGLEDDFILLGKKTNPYPYMKAADLYVQPSRYEGKAVTVTEAQMLAKPVLITNYPTAHGQVNDGVDGIICDLSIAGIADGIAQLYDQPELGEKLTKNCKQMKFNDEMELAKLYQLMQGDRCSWTKKRLA
ncbi:glycosyltransferase [Virgibacillus sp. W0181]|uniref:glycosyltransferase n=1 Tax=Virgibacillus sp. W0181 TaxID=3391581 RepID=UPI003F464361